MRTGTPLVLLAIFVLGCQIDHPPGVLVAEEPRQEPVDNAEPWPYEDYVVTPLATFSLKARLLHKEKYSWDREAELSPWDLALGWQEMSDSAVLDQLDISQSGRWYFWRWSGSPPLDDATIAANSANMHIIPANDDVRSALRAVTPGHIVTLEGSLVAVQGKDGWRWNSSTSRTDTGGGSCEVVWVERLWFGE